MPSVEGSSSTAAVIAANGGVTTYGIAVGDAALRFGDAGIREDSAGGSGSGGTPYSHDSMAGKPTLTEDAQCPCVYIRKMLAVGGATNGATRGAANGGGVGRIAFCGGVGRIACGGGATRWRSGGRAAITTRDGCGANGGGSKCAGRRASHAWESGGVDAIAVAAGGDLGATDTRRRSSNLPCANWHFSPKQQPPTPSGSLTHKTVLYLSGSLIKRRARIEKTSG